MTTSEDKKIAEEVFKGKTETKDIKKNIQHSRKIAALGCGDGGCVITSALTNLDIRYSSKIAQVGFNLSSRNEALYRLKKFYCLEGYDGSGKNRDVSSKAVSQHTELTTKIVNSLCTEEPEIITIKSTTAGGSGSGASPILAMETYNTISDANKSTPIILLGITPKIEDEADIKNTIDWMDQVVEKLDMPYMIFSNDRVNALPIETNKIVNDEIVNAYKLLVGSDFISSDQNSIDTRDVLTTIDRPGRINIYWSTRRPSSNETLDGYIKNLVETSSQEEPLYPDARCLFVKAPIEILKGLDSSLPNFEYGNPKIKYVHLEPSEKDVFIGMITAGSSGPVKLLDRLSSAKNELEYIKEQKKNIAVNKIEMDDPFKSEKRAKKSL